MPTVLVADDEKSMRDFLSIMLTKDGYEVIATDNGKEAISKLQNEPFDLIISDIKMPGASGLELLRTAADCSPLTPVIMITAYGSTGSAVEAMKEGAYDYITKPFKIDEIKLTIRKAMEKKRLQEENLYLKRELKTRYHRSKIVGCSAKMKKVCELIEKVADSRSTVLISGRSGTGKELVARAIHFEGARKDMPFISINCGALPEQLLESELFGHQKGAFTGADSTKEGLLELANGGTFFLDEVGAMPPSIQVKLLRVLQDREFKRLGGTKDIKVDVRIVAATNRNLAEEVVSGKFREDLFYRLNVIGIELPALRDRKEDIPLLVDHFLAKYCTDSAVPTKRVSAQAMALFQNYNWPGNVRELENAIERAVALVSGDITYPEHLPPNITNPIEHGRLKGPEFSANGLDLVAVLDEVEKNFLLKALEQSGGVKKKAAELLRLSFRSMRYRLKKHDIH